MRFAPLHWTAASIAVLGWVVVVRGLCTLTPTTDPVLDLEAGGGFAANFAVYLPGMVLTVVFAVLLVVAGITRRAVVPAVVIGLVGAAFSAWTMTQDYLLAYLPGLDTHLLAGIGLGVVSALLSVFGWVLLQEEPVT